MELATFRLLDHEGKIAVLIALLEALAVANRGYLRLRRDTPAIYAARVPYVKEPPETDNWQDLPRCLELGMGDCEDLCAWRVAELREQGEQAGFTVRHYFAGGVTYYHVLVQRADGSVEDISRNLGMP